MVGPIVVVIVVVIVVLIEWRLGGDLSDVRHRRLYRTEALL
jgi:hypothetical protein